MTTCSRVQAQAAFVLHTRPYLETSAIVELLTLEHGRVAAVAKGMRRPSSRLKGVLQPFVSLQVDWRGKQELKTLGSAEPVGVSGLLSGPVLMCGLYVNELIQRLLAPLDPHPKLYVYYQYVINALRAAEDIEGALRTFEHQLLKEIGYGFDLRTVTSSQLYLFEPSENQFRVVVNPAKPLWGRCFHGDDLLAIEQDCYDTAAQLQAAKRLMRLALDQQLGERPLQSRLLFKRS